MKSCGKWTQVGEEGVKQDDDDDDDLNGENVSEVRGGTSTGED